MHFRCMIALPCISYLRCTDFWRCNEAPSRSPWNFVNSAKFINIALRKWRICCEIAMFSMCATKIIIQLNLFFTRIPKFLELGAVQKHANPVDHEKRWKMCQILLSEASIWPRTSPERAQCKDMMYHLYLYLLSGTQNVFYNSSIPMNWDQLETLKLVSSPRLRNAYGCTAGNADQFTSTFWNPFTWKSCDDVWAVEVKRPLWSLHGNLRKSQST